MSLRAFLQKGTDVSDETAFSMIRLDETSLVKKEALFSETSVHVYQTIRRHIPEDSNRHCHHCNNLK